MKPNSIFSVLLFFFLCTNTISQPPSEKYYTRQWQKVDSLSIFNLYKSALNTVEIIFAYAKKENNNDQKLKALLYKLAVKKRDIEYENNIVGTIDYLKQEIGKSETPETVVLYNMLAQEYQNYYRRYRWKISNRSAIQVDEKDINTWDISQLLNTTARYYLQSLENAKRLQKIELTDRYKELIIDHNAHLRPTLYDFLAHKAIDFFIAHKNKIVQPIVPFILNKENYLSPYDVFSNISITTPDTLDFVYTTLKILQELTLLHKTDKSPESLIDVEIKRLKFVYKHCDIEHKKDLYRGSLEILEERFKEYAAVTEIRYLLAKEIYERGQKYRYRVSPQYRWDYKLALEKCDQAINDFPDSYGARHCKNLISLLTKKNIGITTERIYPTESAILLKLDYRNVNRSYFRIYKTTEQDFANSKEAYKKCRQDTAKNYQCNENKIFLEYWEKKVPSHRLYKDLPAVDDYRPHTTEILIPNLQLGNYIVFATTNPVMKYDEHATASSRFSVSNLAFIERKKNDEERDLYVFDRNTGQSLSNVEVTIQYRDPYNYKTRKNTYTTKTRTTNEQGYVNISEPKKTTPRSIQLKHGDDSLSISSRFDYKSFYKYRKRTNTVFFTDRKIYRPSQTIYFKAIMYETDDKKNNEILTNKVSKIEFLDANWNLIKEEKFTTNEYGTFSGQFTIPEGLLNGRMTIRNENSRLNIQVEEYKRPKFDVKFEPVRGEYRLNDSVFIAGKSTSFSGANIDNAQVKYRIVRETLLSPISRRWRGIRPPDNAPAEIANGITQTNATGKFTIAFKAKPGIALKKALFANFTYTIYVDVTDINGETRSNSKSLTIGKHSLIIDTEIKEQVEKEGNHKFKIISTNLNGEFEPAKIGIQIDKLENPERAYIQRLWNVPDQFLISEEEYQKQFSQLAHKEKDKFDNWKIEKTVLKQTLNTDQTKELQLNKLSSWTTGVYKIEMTSTDKYGEQVKVVKYFTLLSKKEKSLPYPQYALFKVLTKKTEVGENAEILIGSSQKNVNALFEIEQNGVVLKKEWISLSKEQKLLEIPILEEYRGNVNINYIFIKDSRTFSHTATINVPYTNKDLHIRYETFRDKLQPGGQEEWKIHISGPHKEKVKAEVVTTLYDASLDEFANNTFAFNTKKFFSPRLTWNHKICFAKSRQKQLIHKNWNLRTTPVPAKQYNEFNWNIHNHIGETWMQILSQKKSQDIMISGTIINATNKEVLPNVRISTSSNKQTTLSNSKGKFEIRIPNTKSEILSFHRSGFYRLKKKVKGEMKIKVMMKEHTNKLQETEMSSYRDVLKKGIQYNISSNSLNLVAEENQNEKKTAAATKPNLTQIQPRKNFEETAFFYPYLRTDENSDATISFTIPEALTRWKLLGFAHTQDLKYTTFTHTTTTSKDLMIIPEIPRFLRQGDTMTLSAKVTNLSDKELKGTARLMLFNTRDRQAIDSLLNNTNTQKKFTAPKKQSTMIHWKIQVPSNIASLRYRIIAEAGNFSDAEENILPILTNRTLVTESLPLWTSGKQTKTFVLDKLSTPTESRTHHKLTLEYSSNPTWYAIHTLPYLMEYPYESSEQIFSQLYANTISTHIVNSQPQIKEVFNQWKQAPDGNTFLSNLEKKQELKNIVLQETPWMQDATDEQERKKRIALLFNLNKMNRELNKAINKLKKRQKPNGSWSWFEGLLENRHITQHITNGLAKLQHLDIAIAQNNPNIRQMLQNATTYLDKKIIEEYENLETTIYNKLERGKEKNIEQQMKKELQKNHLSYAAIHYLYGRSFTKNTLKTSIQTQKILDYYLQQAKKYWNKQNIYMQGMIALTLHRFEKKENIGIMLQSFKENAKHKEEMGTYWSNKWGYFWYQSPIETQALMIQVFNEITQDTALINNAKTWLIRQKQVQDWKTTKATTAAIYALLLNGNNWLAVKNNLQLKVGKQNINPYNDENLKAEAATGYIKTSWNKNEIQPDMEKITLTSTADIPTYGSLYWQYFEQLDKITPHETPLKLEKKLFIENTNHKGKILIPVEQNNLKIGDKVIVRIILRTDRTMEYIHLKDMRAACFEPLNVTSTHKYKNGLYYYETTKDAATHFFFDRLRKGTYVFEYPLRVTIAGNYSNGITTIQSIYAPEFTSHSEGVRVNINEK